MRNLRFSIFEVWYLSDGIHAHPSAFMDIPGHGHRKILEEDRRRRGRIGEGVEEDVSIDARQVSIDLDRCSIIRLSIDFR